MARGQSQSGAVFMVQLVDVFCRVVTKLMAVALMVMVGLVFCNVVLRYVFNSSITQSEEISRWLFVWITFMGCVVALRERTHLGTDALVSRLPRTGKKLCLVAGHLTMLYVCWLVWSGAWEQTRINLDVLAPSTQMPMAILHSAGVAFAACAGVVLLLDLWLLFTGSLEDDQLVLVQESEELASLQTPAGHNPARKP